MVSCVSPADSRRVSPSLTFHSKLVSADPHSVGESCHCLKINPELTDIIGALGHLDLAAACAGGGVGARKIRVPDITGVGGDGGATGRGHYDTANPKSTGTVAVSRAPLATTL